VGGVGDIRLTIEFPGAGAPPDPEIWPDDCSVGQMLPRLLANARARDRTFDPTGRDFGLFLKRSSMLLPREQPLAALGVVSGDVLVLRDESDLKARREHYVEYARMIAHTGVVEKEDAAELARMRSLALLDVAEAARLLADAGLAAEWVERTVGEREHCPEELSTYRKTLSGVPRDGNVPDDLLRALSKIRSRHEIGPDVHRALCGRMGMAPALIDRLLVELPPREDGLAAYKKEMEFLRKTPASSVEELKPLVRIQKHYRIALADHQRIAQEAGFTPREAELIWDGIPPRMLEREAAIDAYRTVLKAAWFDQSISGRERENLAQVRGERKITVAEHSKLCRELVIPADVADSLLRPESRHRARAIKVLAGLAILVLGVAALVESLPARIGTRPGAVPAGVHRRAPLAGVRPGGDRVDRDPVRARGGPRARRR
jgi:hypothetical protein